MKRVFNYITFEQKQELQRLSHEGLGVREASKITGIPRSTLYYHIRKHGGWENYTPCVKRMQVLNDQTMFNLTGKYESRITSLEMQVEILLEQIREIKGQNQC